MKSTLDLLWQWATENWRQSQGRSARNDPRQKPPSQKPSPAPTCSLASRMLREVWRQGTRTGSENEALRSTQQTHGTSYASQKIQLICFWRINPRAACRPRDSLCFAQSKHSVKLTSKGSLPQRNLGSIKQGVSALAWTQDSGRRMKTHHYAVLGQSNKYSFYF